MSTRDLMFRLPEVAYLVDRIPIARFAIKANAVHLRFLQHARDSRMPLREQCAAFNVPWHARKVSAMVACRDILRLARTMPATLFAQTVPDDPEAAGRWAMLLIDAREYMLPTHATAWVAHNATSICELTESRQLFRYLQKSKALKASTPVDEVVRRAEKQAAQGTRMIISASDLILNTTRPRMLFDDVGEMIGIDFGNGVGLRNSEQAKPLPEEIAYSSRQLQPFNHSGHSVKLLTKPAEFNALGNEMVNCIAARDEGGFFVIRSKRNYFAPAARREISIAVVRHDDAAVAAVEYTPDWSIRSIKGPRNRDVVDVSVLSAAVAFGQMAREA